MFNPERKDLLLRRLYNILLVFSITLCGTHSLWAHPTVVSSANDTLDLAANQYEMAKTYRDNKEFLEADEYFASAQDLYQQVENWNMAVICAIYRSQINYDLVRLDTLAEILQQAQQIIDRQELRNEHFKQERIFFFQALYYEKTAQYQAASNLLDRATEILAGLEKPIALDSAYMSSHKALSGSIYYERRDFEMAINHYQTALLLFPPSRPDTEKLLTIYNNLGLALIEKGQVEKGMEYLSKCLDILPQLHVTTDYDDFLQTYFNLARGNLLLDHIPEATSYLQLASEILSHHPSDRHIWYSLSAQVAERQGRLEEALQYYQSALTERKRIRGNGHPSVAKLLLAIGDLYTSLRQEEKALGAFQQGLQVFDPSLHQKELFQVPTLTGVNDYYLIIQLLNKRGELLQKHHPGQASEILPTYRIAIQAIDSLRLLYESDASKLLLSKDGKTVFASALGLLHQIYQQTADQSLLEEAFRYMEKSKSLLLLENIRKWRNIRMQNSGRKEGSDQFMVLVEQEKNAKLDLLFLKRTIEDTREGANPPEPAYLENLEKELRKVTGQYETIKGMISESFPQYYAASYGDEVAGTADIQTDLLSDRGTALISYFIFEEQSFAMLIGQKELMFQQLSPQVNWQSAFAAYQSALKTQGKPLLQNRVYTSYQQAASLLYNYLLRPLIEKSSERLSRLYLVPDDILGFLAFESLLLSPPAGPDINYSLDYQDYLIEHYALSYGYSATLLQESLAKRKGQDERADYGGFAPVFQDGSGARAVSRDCTTGNLMYLPYSEISVQETNQILDGKAFLHQDASLENFKKAAREYRILQLATHACVDENDALYNVIYFHDTTLATYEIFDIPLRADLIILSACETGSGDLLQGEGIMSLSRGFYYAGSSNIVTSLWPADDHATMTLMVRFNEYLSQGLPKDQALQRAKLDYLTADNLRNMEAAPAFWANFILIGNQNKIALDANSWSSMEWLLLPFLGISLILTLFYALSWRK